MISADGTAVKRGDGDRELVVGRAGHLGGVLGLRGGLRGLVGAQRERADGRVRADIGAAVALDAVFRQPLGHRHRDAAFLVGDGDICTWRYVYFLFWKMSAVQLFYRKGCQPRGMYTSVPVEIFCG